ncbi:hypothetical protein AXF42_Ash018881 [Apostasia shenzhenica]|uniref:Uncharacterized protein n=1 Tax=Apostasia shenzhenica TaxID=1088818 RepID=A0A2I0B515_9ASPA|nr:hypothetical protein AXF42_Ash018881 [Apostasia shenzhenica]
MSHREFKSSAKDSARRPFETSLQGVRIFSMDSDLEAFNRNPAYGSFAPLAFQPSTMTMLLVKCI